MRSCTSLHISKLFYCHLCRTVVISLHCRVTTPTPSCRECDQRRRHTKASQFNWRSIRFNLYVQIKFLRSVKEPQGVSTRQSDAQMECLCTNSVLNCLKPASKPLQYLQKKRAGLPSTSSLTFSLSMVQLTAMPCAMSRWSRHSTSRCSRGGLTEPRAQPHRDLPARRPRDIVSGTPLHKTELRGLEPGAPRA